MAAGWATQSNAISSSQRASRRPPALSSSPMKAALMPKHSGIRSARSSIVSYSSCDFSRCQSPTSFPPLMAKFVT